MGKKPKGKGKKGGKAAVEEEAQKKAAAAAAAKKKAAEEEAQRAKQEEAEREAEAKRKAEEEEQQQQQQEEEEEEEEEEAQATAEGAAGDDERVAVYEAMRPMQLKDECRKRGLPPEGLKEELIERLLDYDEREGVQPEPEEEDSLDERESRASDFAAPDGTVSGSIILETELPRSAAKLKEFRDSVIKDLAQKMGVDPSRIQITSLDMVEEEVEAHRDGVPRRKASGGLGPGGVWARPAKEATDADDAGGHRRKQQNGGGGGGGSDGGEGSAESSSLETADLDSMKFSELAQLARDEGVDEDTIEDCMDQDQPNEAIIQCLNELRRARRRSSEAEQEQPTAAAAPRWTRDELGDKKMPQPATASQLCRLATDAGVDPEKLDGAMAGDNPKAGLIELLLRVGGGAEADSATAKPAHGFSLEELRKKRVVELASIAREEHIDESKIDDAMDADNPKQALVDLLGDGSSGGQADERLKDMERADAEPEATKAATAAKEQRKPKVKAENYKKMNEKTLRLACQKRDLPSNGSKKALLQRLEQFDRS